MYKESQEACQKVLEKDPDNVKALYRSGKVRNFEFFKSMY